MKRFLALVVLVLSTSAFANIKVGVVSIQKVINSIKEGKKVTKELEGSFKKKQKQLSAEEEKIKKLQQDFKKQVVVLSDKAKRTKENEIGEMIMALKQKTVEYQREMTAQEQKLKKPILDKLKKVVDDVSKKQNLDLTFEASASPVIYSKTTVDITGDVIKAYDQKYGK